MNYRDDPTLWIVVNDIRVQIIPLDESCPFWGRCIYPTYNNYDTRQSSVVPTITRDTSVEEPEAIKSYLQVQKSHMLTHIEGVVAYVGQLPAEKLAVAENSELPGLIEISESVAEDSELPGLIEISE